MNPRINQNFNMNHNCTCGNQIPKERTELGYTTCIPCSETTTEIYKGVMHEDSLAIMPGSSYDRLINPEKYLVADKEEA